MSVGGHLLPPGGVPVALPGIAILGVGVVVYGPDGCGIADMPPAGCGKEEVCCCSPDC